MNAETVVQSPISLWQKLDVRGRAVVAAATVAMFVAIIALARMGGTPQMALLYAGLDPAAAGEVVAALDRQGVTYRIEGDSIQVPADKRDSLRMVLAAEGLPANAGTGYELLDSLSGFGTTSQMFDAAYWRAKEGELARTILSNPSIRLARVHIARAPDQPFARESRPTASVTVTAPGGLSRAQAKALRHLVAAAVAGMKPEDVAVIDTESGLVGEDEGGAEVAGGTRAAEIRANVERLLAAHLGAGKAAVEVAVDLVTEREAITERRFDPQGRVAVSSETEAKSGSSTDPGGAVTVASNLPDGDAKDGAAGQSKNTESRERVNYQVSETQREVIRVPGSIRRLSVAVLVDGRQVTGDGGQVSIQPRSDEELGALRELVASAVGLDESRGDVLVVKSLAFEPGAEAGSLADAGGASPLARLDLMSVIQIGVLAVVALVLGLFVLRPMLIGSRRAGELPAPSTPLALPPAGQVLTGEIDEGGVVPTLHVVSPAGTEVPVDPVARLRRLIEERQAESVEILRGWMEHEEERG
ncbi:MAG: flagellar basal-body MS-ring/collar protein FliF [Paracoccaceae bacterium]